MKKRILCTALASVLCLSTAVLAGCGGTVEIRYDNQIKGDKSYNENLFYRNDCEIPGADPMVLKITDRNSPEYGYYYQYSTNSFTVYRSKDLHNWENVSKKVGHPAYILGENDFGAALDGTFWAPEVVYDEDDGKYYLFFSMEPRYGDANHSDETLMCAVSDQPYGPFVAVKEGVANPNRDHALENYFFDMPVLTAKLREKYPQRFAEDYTYAAALDPNPFTDPATGKKYLYWTSERYDAIESETCVFGMEMENWTTPKYDTVTMLTRPRYTTVDGNEICDAEIETNTINEGAFMYAKPNGNGGYTYYLTLSVNNYNNKTYSAIQAIGSSPLGAFTKLQKSDGGVLLGTDNQLWDHLSGPGHHSFVEEGGKLYILYHQHIDVVAAGAARALSLDEVKFVTNDKGQEVMYVNGPTRSIQLLPEFASEYKNIAGDAKITASNKEDAGMLTDGLLSLYSYIDYVKEFRAKDDVTFTLEFDDYREVTGLMVYNSKNFEEAFDSVADIKIYFLDGDEKRTGEIVDVAFNWEEYQNGNQDGMRPGGSAIALFAPLQVNKIEVTVKVPTSRAIGQDNEGYYVYQTAVALSEIKVIGK